MKGEYKGVILSDCKMDCKPELSATLTKKSANHLVPFQIDTHIPHKNEDDSNKFLAPYLSHELVSFLSINKNRDREHKFSVEKIHVRVLLCN